MRRLLTAIWLSTFLVSLDYTAVNVALPSLARTFDVGTSAISWIALAYILVVVALTLPAGAAINRIGYLRALGWSLVLFALASLLSALSSSLWALVAMRALQGIGGSVMFAIGPAVIKTMFPAKTQGRAFALFSTAATGGLCAGPAIGGQLTGLFGWESIFFFSLIAALLALALVWSVARDAVRPAERAASGSMGRMVSPLSVALACTGLFLFLLALNQGQAWGWRSPPILFLFVSSLATLALLSSIERRAASPLIEPAVFASREFVASCAILFPLLLVFGGTVFLMPFYLEWLRRDDAGLAGRILMIQPAATIAGSFVSGLWLAGAMRRLVCALGVSLFALGFALLANADRHAPLAVLAVVLCLTGGGMGLFYPTLIQMGVSDVPNSLAASASGLQAAGRSLAQLLGVVVFETVFSGLFPLALAVDRAAAATGPALVDMQRAFGVVFWLAAALAGLALLLCLLLMKPEKSAELRAGT